MNESCPSCGLRFEREPGYFVAAMYISYGAAVLIITALFWAVSWLAPGASFAGALGIAALIFLPLVPAVFRYSRVLWIHMDRAIDPR